jgi:3-phosphoshikimate 1-carboxyvinyltransferase
MKLYVNQSSLKGRVAIPGSKSHTIRCVVIASLAHGVSEIMSPLIASDSLSAVTCYRALGATIDTSNGTVWKITGTGGELSVGSDLIDVGNSGTTLRFAVGSAALLKEGTAHFTGDHQICSRPISPLLTSLNGLGADCKSVLNNGMAPLDISGTIVGGKTSIEAITSQYLSSLLINTPLAPNDTEIEVPLLNEQPYVEITLDYLDQAGIEYENHDFKTFMVKGGQRYQSFKRRVAADFSSATFFLCGGAILDSDLVIEGLDFNDTQGDKAVVEILRQMGADIIINGQELSMKHKTLTGIDIDMNAIPDALPALAVVGCFAKGTTRLLNVAQARLKETDRIAVMCKELSAMGAQIEELEDGLVIHQSKLNSATLGGHHDHRIVMALSLAAMTLKEESVIDTAEAIDITFPNYVKLMNAVGGNMRVVDENE